MRRVFQNYFLLCGILIHVTFLVGIVSFTLYKVSGHWRVQQVLQSVQESSTPAPVLDIAETEGALLDFSSIPSGKWLKIHQIAAGDELKFRRQEHSGSAWDNNRQRIMIFGSDTHGKDWDNSVYFFDLESRFWSRSGPPDGRDTYRASDKGLAVAGDFGGDRPWAMHAFDALAYDPINDRLIVASAPRHLAPGAFGNWMVGLWEKVKRHPTWFYSIGENAWYPAAGRPQNFFPFATAYNSSTFLLIGFKPDGIFEFDTEKETWRKVAASSVAGYHTQAVYDNHNRAFVVFGENDKRNVVHSYRPGDKKSKKMPTPGIRPPADEHVPLAFHSRLKVTVALVDNGSGAETWGYDLPADNWKRFDSAEFPFKLGMNYHMQYSAKHDLLILVASKSAGLPEVWILRL
jgi:hypothetical protein